MGVWGDPLPESPVRVPPRWLEGASGGGGYGSPAPMRQRQVMSEGGFGVPSPARTIGGSGSDDDEDLEDVGVGGTPGGDGSPGGQGGVIIRESRTEGGAAVWTIIGPDGQVGK